MKYLLARSFRLNTKQPASSEKISALDMTNKPADSKQLDKFKAAAREVETDDREEAFDAIVKKIAKSPPSDDKPPKKAA